MLLHSWMMLSLSPKCPTVSFSVFIFGFLVKSNTCLSHSLLRTGTWTIKPVFYYQVPGKRRLQQCRCWELLGRVWCNVKVCLEMVSDFVNINDMTFKKINTYQCLHFRKKHTIWWQCDMMNIFTTGISNKWFQLTFVVKIIKNLLI